VNRLNKTKEEREVDHEQERVDREKKESAERKAAALKQRKEAEELAKKYAEEKASRDYSVLDVDPTDEEARRTAREMMDDFM